MLLALKIKNFALIDEIDITFHDGLNILTGETGAGKSIIIDAVNMAIGERADRNFVRFGTDKCIVQAVFLVSNIKEIDSMLQQFGIEIDSDNILVITREIRSNGRSICRINGTVVTQTIVKSVTQYLIDIHGQHEHQSLLNSNLHIDMLDLYGGKEVLDLVNTVSNKYNQLQTLKKELSSICFDKETESDYKIDLIEFQINEIESANLQPGEDEKLTTKRNILANSEKIYQALASAYELLNGENIDFSLLGILGNTIHTMQRISAFDEKLLNLTEFLEEIQYKLEDIATDIRNYKEQIDFKPEIIENIEMRLDLINMLKRKYGKSIQEILKYKQDLEIKMHELKDNEEKIKKIKKKINIKHNELVESSIKLSKLRQSVALSFEKQITEILSTLSMEKIKFKVLFNNNSPIDTKPSPKGIDKVEFVISTNLGEPLKPLSKIVSGGEMSRIMLAFKTILADIDNIPTLIFDEIDIGISGRTAQTIGERLYDISNNHQIICITHLPQIASMADHHYLIEKVEKGNNMKTSVIKLNKKGRIRELGRLLDGQLTDITIKHAEEMIEQAYFKKNN